MQETPRKFLQKFSQLEAPFQPELGNSTDQTQFITLLLPAGIYSLNSSKIQFTLSKSLVKQKATASDQVVAILQRSDCAAFIRQQSVRIDGKIQMVVQDGGALSYLYYYDQMEHDWQYKNLTQYNRIAANTDLTVANINKDAKHSTERHFKVCKTATIAANNTALVVNDVSVIYDLKHILPFLFDKQQDILHVKQQLEIKMQIQASQLTCVLNLDDGILLGQGKGVLNGQAANDETNIKAQLIMYQYQIDPATYDQKTPFYKYIYQTKTKSDQLTQIVYSPQSLVHKLLMQYFTDVTLAQDGAAGRANFSTIIDFPGVHSREDATYVFNAQPQTIQLNSVQVLNKEANESENVFTKQLQSLESNVQKHNSTGALLDGQWMSQIQINSNMGNRAAQVNQCYTFIDLIPMQ